MLKLFLSLFALVALAAGSAPGYAEDYPSKMIKIIVPFPAGGDLEPVARALGEQFRADWNQPYLVDFKAGAQAMIGTGYVAKSPPDGYTLMICSVGAMTINPSLYETVPYTVGKDIIPVSLVATTPMVLVAGPALPVKNYDELIAYVKAHPGEVSFASAGVGNVTHLAAELFAREAGLSMLHVPYKGAQAVITDLMGGRIGLYFNPLPSARGYLGKDGPYSDKVRAIAITSSKRSPLLPDVPTLDELGLKGVTVNSWYGLCAPGGTPSTVLEKLNAGVMRAVRNEDFVARLSGLGMNPQANTREQFAEDIRKETEQWAKIIKENGIKPQ
ncbi:Bug family tripartite tricarboxylate transporter substrate binding protein [Bordetella sp. 2513F-2]